MDPNTLYLYFKICLNLDPYPDPSFSILGITGTLSILKKHVIFFSFFYTLFFRKDLLKSYTQKLAHEEIFNLGGEFFPVSPSSPFPLFLIMWIWNHKVAE